MHIEKAPHTEGAADTQSAEHTGRPAATAVRRAAAGDAQAAADLLDAFNREYDDVTPGPQQLARRLVQLMADGTTVVLLAGDPAVGVAVLRLRPALWTEALECYLAELYVRPDLRGRGIGRSLLAACLDAARECGADHIDLGTSEDDLAAVALYESMGFTNREGGPGGPVMYCYERDLDP